MSATAGATAAAAAAAAVANAIKASGTLVRVEPEDMRRILDLQEAPLVVVASHRGALFGPKHELLTSYRGLAFYCKSSEPIELPGTAEVIVAKKIWMPS